MQAAKTLTPEVRTMLEKQGIAVKPWNPSELDAVARGQRTFAELLGVTKQKQFDLQAMALKLLKDGLRDKAKEIFQGLQVLDPYDAYNETCLGSIAVDDEDFTAALLHFDRALALNPTSAPAHLMRGELYAKKGKKAEALADLEAAAKSKIAGNHEVVARASVILAALKKAK